MLTRQEQRSDSYSAPASLPLLSQKVELRFLQDLLQDLWTGSYRSCSISLDREALSQVRICEIPESEGEKRYGQRYASGLTNNDLPHSRMLPRTCLKIDDPDKAPVLIQEAEHAIIARARGQFGASGDIIQEEEALNNGLYALRELKRSLAALGSSRKQPGRSRIRRTNDS